MPSFVTSLIKALSGDLIFLLVVFALFLGCTMYFGRNKVASFIIAFYPATLLYNTFPFINKLLILGPSYTVVNKILIFILFLYLVYIAINKYVSLYDESSSGLSKGGLALSSLILVVLFSYSTVNYDSLHNFSPTIDALFQGLGRVFGWSIAPLILLRFT